MITPLYLIGSLRNPVVPRVAQQIRAKGIEVFDDWHAAGPEADDYWQAYEKERNHSYQEALAGWHAQDVFRFDHFHLGRCNGAALILPAGKSGHLELGYMIGQGKPGYILLDKEPDRFDIMYNFADKVCMTVEELIEELL